MFDIAIVGGGHAGIEAASISARLGMSVVLISMPDVPLASAPCNPAVGGVGKGQVVREIDALGGVMGKLADRSAIQYRTLNESKGFAVQSTRVQIDKDRYTENAENYIQSCEGIRVIRDKVERISKDESSHFFIYSATSQYKSRKVIITTGTFLGGELHTGANVHSGGRIDCQSSNELSSILSSVAKLSKRFKTGTPPRLKLDTIDFSKLVEQKSDPTSIGFHWASSSEDRALPQVSCYIAHTNEETLALIRKNKEKSPIFNGQIKGVGPRYCPSIEDKAFRYPDRNRHHVFVEPEGLDLNTAYPNGISTSLPVEIQQEFVRTISGLEKAEIEVMGYAVEYDVVDTSKLNIGLEYGEVPGLYFAGQVNGTSGYEEAAGQGLVAGVNASFSVMGRERFVLSRHDSYIGVMVEDLVSNKRDEPYRLFTARSENRLFIREDNTINRISKYREELNLSEEVDFYQRNYLENYSLLKNLCQKYMYRPTEMNVEVFGRYEYGNLTSNTTMEELLKRSHLNPVKVLSNELTRLGAKFQPDVIRAVAISLKYAGYIERSDRDTDRVQKLAKMKIKWKEVVESKNISNECRQRINEVRPETFSQLQRINGIRPATLAFVAGNLI
jgi:tRNA uridine 5-carboxymethylaminomethyl modification enzyme